jgi:anti-sigma regulatory factor (Ser/Thr protein kinase)
MSGSDRARQQVVTISESGGAGDARRIAASFANALNFDENAAGELALGVTETATNIGKHATSGSIVLRAIEHAGAHGVEVMAIDKGGGIDNVAASMRDGYSTAGSQGAGLGSLQRMTDGFEIWSRPGQGTLMRFEVWPKGVVAPPATAIPGVMSEPKPGEAVSGDGWTLVSARGTTVVCVVDGLGHGPDAAEAARLAMATVEKNPQLDAVNLMDAMHAALRPTRGAAAALAMLDPANERCSYCGIGNISAAVRHGGVSRSMVSQNGTLGHQVRKIQEFQYPLPRGALLVMHSDGISTHWDLSAYPGIEQRHPAFVAAMLARDHKRGRDDLTALALRIGTKEPQ